MKRNDRLLRFLNAIETCQQDKAKDLSILTGLSPHEIGIASGVAIEIGVVETNATGNMTITDKGWRWVEENIRDYITLASVFETKLAKADSAPYKAQEPKSAKNHFVAEAPSTDFYSTKSPRSYRHPIERLRCRNRKHYSENLVQQAYRFQEIYVTRSTHSSSTYNLLALKMAPILLRALDEVCGEGVGLEAFEKKNKISYRSAKVLIIGALEQFVLVMNGRETQSENRKI